MIAPAECAERAFISLPEDPYVEVERSAQSVAFAWVVREVAHSGVIARFPLLQDVRVLNEKKPENN